MSYIGNKPATSFETVQKQVSTTNSGTQITLDRAVTSVQDILVTVDAVIQSYDNYSVSGTTLTLGGTLNNNRVEILYVGRTMQSVDPTDNSVSTAKIQNDAVTKDKVNFATDSTSAGITSLGDGTSSGNSGAIELRCSNNNHGVQLISPDHSASQSWKLKLPDNSPTADKFLKVKSITGSGSTATGQLEFADAPSGGLVHIKTISTTSGSAITFLNGSNGVVLDNTYDVYKIFGSKIVPDGDDKELKIKFTADGGSNYNQTILRVTQQTEANSSSASSAAGYESSTSATIFGAMGGNGSEASYFEATLFKSNDNTFEKAMHIKSFEKQYNNMWKLRNSFLGITAGLNTNEIDGFKFEFTSGNFNNATIRLYGVTNG